MWQGPGIVLDPGQPVWVQVVIGPIATAKQLEDRFSNMYVKHVFYDKWTKSYYESIKPDHIKICLFFHMC